MCYFQVSKSSYKMEENGEYLQCWSSWT